MPSEARDGGSEASAPQIAGTDAATDALLTSLFQTEIETAPVVDVTDAVLGLINAEREKAGCPALVVNAKLITAAQGHSEAMAGQDFFAHRGVDGLGPSERVSGLGYTWLMVGENLAAGNAEAEAVAAQWMDSPGHRSNIMTCAYTETGIGFSANPQDDGAVPYRYYWTQVFARPYR